MLLNACGALKDTESWSFSNICSITLSQRGLFWFVGCTGESAVAQRFKHAYMRSLTWDSNIPWQVESPRHVHINSYPVTLNIRVFLQNIFINLSFYNSNFLHWEMVRIVSGGILNKQAWSRGFWKTPLSDFWIHRHYYKGCHCYSGGEFPLTSEYGILGVWYVRRTLIKESR